MTSRPNRLRGARRLTHHVRADADVLVQRAARHAGQTRASAVRAQKALEARILDEEGKERRLIYAECSRRRRELLNAPEFDELKTARGFADADAWEASALRGVPPAAEERFADERAGVEALFDPLPTLDARASALAHAVGRRDGLAPWDHLALDARRAWGELPRRTPSDAAFLRGGDVEELFHTHLAVSRSEYYKHYRPLLRTHHLGAALGLHHVRRSAGGPLPGSKKGKRWLQEEVTGLIQYLSRPFERERR